MHVSKDVSYKDNNIIFNYVCYVLNVNHRGMFWIVTNCKYQIVGKNVFNNFQDIVLPLGTTTLVANITVEGVSMKE